MTPRKPPKARRRPLVSKDDGRFIVVKGPWHVMSADREAIAAARYLAARERAGVPPVALAGETRSEASARLGVRSVSLIEAARFDPDPLLRQEMALELLEHERRRIVGEDRVEHWCQWGGHGDVDAIDPRMLLCGPDPGHFSADEVLDGLERLRVWGEMLGIEVSPRGSRIVGPPQDDRDALELARMDAAIDELDRQAASAGDGDEMARHYAITADELRARRSGLLRTTNTTPRGKR